MRRKKGRKVVADNDGKKERKRTAIAVLYMVAEMLIYEERFTRGKGCVVFG